MVGVSDLNILDRISEFSFVSTLSAPDDSLL